MPLSLVINSNKKNPKTVARVDNVVYLQEEEQDVAVDVSNDKSTALDRRRVLLVMSQLWRVYTVVSQRELQLMGTGSLCLKVRDDVILDVTCGFVSPPTRTTQGIARLLKVSRFVFPTHQGGARYTAFGTF